MSATELKEWLANRGITVRRGLLWRDGRPLSVYAADETAYQCGFLCAEQLIKAAEGGDK
jgi:hypothetical protein